MATSLSSYFVAKIACDLSHIHSRSVYCRFSTLIRYVLYRLYIYILVLYTEHDFAMGVVRFGMLRAPKGHLPVQFFHEIAPAEERYRFYCIIHVDLSLNYPKEADITCNYYKEESESTSASEPRALRFISKIFLTS